MRKPRSWLAVQANLDPVAMAALKWSPDCLALQHMLTGQGCSSGAATPVTLTLSFCLACCSLNITYIFSCPETKRAVRGRPEPNPASPDHCVTKAGSVFAALTLSPLLLGGPYSNEAHPAFPAQLSSGPSLGQSCWLCAFLLWFLWP